MDREVDKILPDMKGFFFVFFLLSFLQSQSQYTFELNGTVPPLLNNKKLILGINNLKISDTFRIRNNSFSIKGSLNGPSEDAYLLLMDDRYGQTYFVIDSGKNTMIVHEIPPNSITKKNKLSATEMINSKSNVIKKKLDYLVYKDYLEKQKTKNIKSDSIDNERFKRMTREEFSLVQQFPETYYSLVLLNRLSVRRSINLDDLLTAYNNLDDRIKGTPLGKQLKEELLNYFTLEAGNVVKSFTATTPLGAEFANESLKDTTYLLAFGATWCGPCKENIPKLKNLYSKFKNRKFTVVYVNLDGNEKLWKSQIANYGVGWINVSDNAKWKESELVKTFNISVIPLYFIVDQNQKIIYNSRSRSLRNSSFEEMEAIVAKQLVN